MTDQDQAARIAAMRAKRGQAPVAIPTTRTQAIPAEHQMWAPPTHPPVAAAAAASVAASAPASPAASQRPAPTKRTAAPARKKHPHVAAGARILMTGATASAV
ncbi:MAG: hypothetical protein WCC60_09980, partial [Ilumatobacteraceae bacterium]